MKFLADLHIHSKFSRATSRDCDLEHLAVWGLRKGLTLVATGDFTHPVWFEELKEKLVPAEEGLFRLREDLDRAVRAEVPPSCASAPLRFVLSVEISTIYKRDGKTRKVHHVLYAPDFEQAGALRAALGRIGNLASDGRPILGLDSRDLLETALESGPDIYLVPAHIWTPWFSALGSKSGFDSIAECYGDLAGHIFAVETGLSSDPLMNWRVPSLDRYRLVSNSDAHSPAMLGREANAFDCALDYHSVRRAMATGAGFLGTVEFFPEEGKYHLDGHRNCGLRLTPQETKELGGRCPKCGGLITVGVESRVEDLAGRPAGFRPPGAADFESIIPLPEIVSEIEQTGVQSKKVRGVVEALTGRLGPEMAILRDIPVEDIRRAGTPVLAEAISRLRAGRVHRTAGYDGEFGTIRLFEPHELDGHGRSPLLFSLDRLDAASAAKTTAEVSDREAAVPDAVLAEPQPQTGTDATASEISGGETQAAGETGAESQQPPAEKSAAASRWLQGLDEAQTRAAETSEGPLVIIAGPGTGKTRTLTRRLAHLIDDLHADPARCLAVTFTRKAAEEMRERLRDLIPAGAPSIIVDTFHGLALRILREDAVSAGLPPNFAIMDEEGEAGRRALIGRCFQVQPAEAGRMADRFRREPGSGEAETFRRFLAEQGLVDLDAVIPMTVELLETHPEIAARWRARLDHVSIDEFQDIDEAQYRLACLLSLGTESLCVIGDPDQSIYSFRGASPGFFRRFIEDHPGTTEIRLVCNYRSSPVIVSAALHAIAPQTLVPGRALTACRAGVFPDKIQLFDAQDARAEADFIAESIESRVGGTSHRTFDEHPELGHADASSDRSFCDFAVLYRTDAQAEALMEALSRRSIPCQKSGHTRLSAHRGVRELRDILRQADLAGSQSEMSLSQRLLEAARQLAERRGGWRDDSSGAEALELLQPLASRSGSLTEFLAAIQQGAEADAPDVRAQKVSLLTMHASKGLEFPVVFIAGCDDGLIPFRLRAGQLTEEALAEERRLFFVAVTRARDELILTRARKRLIQGAECAPAPSAFLGDLDPRCLSHVSADAAKGAGRRRRQRQLKLF